MAKQLKENKLEVIRHSTAHLLAAAVTQMFPKVKLGIGPTIENGFYYDFDLPAGKQTSGENEQLKPADLPALEKRVRELIKKDLKFKKEIITFAEAKKLFSGQPYKLELIKELNKNKEKISAYKTLDKKEIVFLDLCAGPHVASTREIPVDSFKLTHLAGAYWRGDETHPMLTRIYGVAFNTKKDLDDYLKMLEVAEQCDHRVLGERLDYFMFDEEIGKGLPLWLPKGHSIRHRLEEYMYELEIKNGYQHVLCPILAKEDLYRKSGHLAHYKEDMYAPVVIEKEKYYLKPMNCPHHHSIYKHRKRSYRELPLRIAEFGNVYRYERSGVLTGMVRVRGFTQNDSHIYTDELNLEKEIINVINLTEEVYKTFGIKDYWYRLSLPDFKNKEKFGDIKNKEQWERSSDFLRRALKNTGHKFVEAIGEATFYGPKIDIQTKDVWGHEDSIGTIQVDYYSAPRFNLLYVDKDGKEKPIIIIHRAIMGAFERFFSFLLEKTCGNLPVWLAPVQVEIINVGSGHRDYAKQIYEKLKENDIRASLSDENLTVSKRIRDAEIQKIPYILVVGDKEKSAGTVSERGRSGKDYGQIKIENFILNIQKEISDKTL